METRRVLCFGRTPSRSSVTKNSGLSVCFRTESLSFFSTDFSSLELDVRASITYGSEARPNGPLSIAVSFDPVST